MNRLHLPTAARIAAITQENYRTRTLTLDAALDASPGQFVMAWLPRFDEKPFSLVAADPVTLMITAVGPFTRLVHELGVGDSLWLRGPFGRGWPLAEARGHDLLLVTGGLGCAPLVSVINYVAQRRDEFGHVAILQGVKHMDDMIWRERYTRWAGLPDVQVLLAADVAGAGWSWHVGLVTELVDQIGFDVRGARVMVCGPEPMMLATVRKLGGSGVPEAHIWLSLERNMQCAVGHCGHCQFGAPFVCKDGPVFNYPQIRDRLGVKGF